MTSEELKQFFTDQEDRIDQLERSLKRLSKYQEVCAAFQILENKNLIASLGKGAETLMHIKDSILYLGNSAERALMDRGLI